VCKNCAILNHKTPDNQPQPAQKQEKKTVQKWVEKSSSVANILYFITLHFILLRSLREISDEFYQQIGGKDNT
jgi:hypothetical protein